MKANFASIGHTIQVEFKLDLLSPRDQANLLMELLAVTGAQAIMMRHSSPGSGEYQSVVTDIWDAITTHWSKAK